MKPEWVLNYYLIWEIISFVINSYRRTIYYTSYRAVLRSVYPGSRWDDTCLGEITYYKEYEEREKEDSDTLWSDEFYMEFLGKKGFLGNK